MLYQIPYFNISDAVGYVAEVGGSVFCHLKWSEQTIQRILYGLIWTVSCFVLFFFSSFATTHFLKHKKNINHAVQLGC